MSSTSFNIRGLDLASQVSIKEKSRSFSMAVDGLVDMPVNTSYRRVDTHVVVNKGFIAAVKRAFNSLNDLYYENFPLSLQRRFSYIGIACGKTGQLVGSLQKGLAPIFTIFGNAALAGEALCSNFKGVVSLAKKTPVLLVFSIPIYLTLTIKDIAEVAILGVKGKGDLAGEKGLLALEHFSDLTFVTRSFLQGLKAVGSVSSTVFTAASTYLIGIGAILSLAGICKHAKRIYDCFQLRKKFFKKDDLKSIVKEINSRGNKELVNKLGVSDGGKFKVRMRAIYKSHLADESKVERVKNALKRRISMKALSHSLKIAALAVSIAASVVLLCTPAAPAGFILLATSAAIGLSMAGLDFITEEQFNRVLRKLAPRDCTEMQMYHMRKKIKKDPIFQHWQPKKQKIEPLKAEKRRIIPLNKDQRELFGDFSHILAWQPK